MDPTVINCDQSKWIVCPHIKIITDAIREGEYIVFESNCNSRTLLLTNMGKLFLREQCGYTDAIDIVIAHDFKQHLSMIDMKIIVHCITSAIHRERYVPGDEQSTVLRLYLNSELVNIMNLLADIKNI
jgi:hypothetical protein